MLGMLSFLGDVEVKDIRLVPSFSCSLEGWNARVPHVEEAT